MESETVPPGSRMNYRRRLLGVAICLAPLAVPAVSLGVGLTRPQQSGIGLALAAAGLLVSGFNLYLSLVRPLLYALRHSSFTGMRHVSGIPVLGTLLVVAGGSIGFADWRCAAAGLAALVLDTSGLPWFLLTTWRDRSLWDGER